MLRRNKTEDSLFPKFDGPFDVLWRKGPNVKLRLPHRDKWVHLDHVKRYSGSAPSVIQATHGQMLTSPEVLTPGKNQPEENMESADWAQQTLGVEEGTGESSGADIPERRYPSRVRRPPKHLMTMYLGRKHSKILPVLGSKTQTASIRSGFSRGNDVIDIVVLVVGDTNP